jgi:peroxiredoxin
MKKIIVFILFFNFHFCFSQSKEQFLLKTIDRINSFNCVVYGEHNFYSSPGDSLPINSLSALSKVIMNKSDSIAGSNFMYFLEDTSKVIYNYHENIEIEYNWDNNTATIDTINFEDPNQYVFAPYLIRVKSLLSYAIKYKDSVEYQSTIFNDTTQITFIFKNRVVEFLNLKPFINQRHGEFSKYTLWTDKNFLPYKLKRRVPHNTSIEEITYISEGNCDEITDKQVGIYLPDGFTIQDRKGMAISTSGIEGQLAYNWILESVDGDSVRLSDYKEKNLLLEFTGVGCGPCHQAIPFLKKMENESKTKGFSVVSIESFSKNKSSLKRYRDQNQINYPFLIADKETIKSLNILAMPVFLFINRTGIIEKVIVGYKKDLTDIEISNYLSKMK